MDRYDQPEKQKLAKLFADPKAKGTSLLLAFLDGYTPEKTPEDSDPLAGEFSPLKWNIQTIRGEIERDLKISFPNVNLHRLMAAIAITISDDFFERASVFQPLALALAGEHEHDYSTIDLPSPFELAWAVSEGVLLAQAENRGEEEHPFSEEVCAYIGEVLKEEGFIKPPRSLELAADADLSATVSENFEESPDLYNAVWSAHRDKADDVDAFVSEGMLELANQLVVLPLKDGDVRPLVDRIVEAYAPEIRNPAQGANVG